MKTYIAALAAGCILPAHAGDFTALGSLTQPEFHRLAQDLGAAFSYKGVIPATPLGPIGFDVGLELTQTDVENSDVFAKAGAGDQSKILVPKLHVNKGLFAGVDIGAFLGGSSDVGAALFGMDLRYAILADTLTTPAIALRGSGTVSNGMDNLRVGTAALDVMVSKQLTLVTPYAGVGVTYVRAKPSNTALSDESFSTGRVFGGVNLNLGTANLALEAEKMGDNTSYSAKIGFRF